jgi:hypothetical protein
MDKQPPQKIVQYNGRLFVEADLFRILNIDPNKFLNTTPATGSSKEQP